jgi:hypothetical protein
MLTVVHVVMTALHANYEGELHCAYCTALMYCIDARFHYYLYACYVITIQLYLLLGSSLITLRMSRRCLSHCDVTYSFAFTITRPEVVL